MIFLSSSILENYAGLTSAVDPDNGVDKEDRFCTTEFALGVAIRTRTFEILDGPRFRTLHITMSLYDTAFMMAMFDLATEIVHLNDPRLNAGSDWIKNDNHWAERPPPDPDNNHAHGLGVKAHKYRLYGLSLFPDAYWDDVSTLLKAFDGFRNVRQYPQGCPHTDCHRPNGIGGHPWWQNPPPPCANNVWYDFIAVIQPQQVSVDPICVRGAGGILVKQVCMAGNRHNDTIVYRRDSSEADLHTHLQAQNFLGPYPKTVAV